MRSNKLYLVVPCYNEEEVLRETSRRLLEKRYGGDESRKDLHEANLRYLMACRGAALYAAEHWGWKVIRCCDGSDPYPPEQIHQAVLAEVDAWLRRQHPAESDGF